MKKSIFVLSVCFMVVAAFANETKPLYQLPSYDTTSIFLEDTITADNVFLVGSDSGLFRITDNNSVLPVWEEDRVDQIIPVTFENEKGLGDHTEKGWYLRTRKGIFYTNDLKTFEERNEGLPFLTIKKYDGETKVLEKQIQELKDLSVNPLNNKEIVTATKDNVYYSSDGGLSWRDIGSMSVNTPGIKAVAVATIDNESVVFMSQPIFGFSYKYPNVRNSKWHDITGGFEIMKSLSYPDEIADILPVVKEASDGSSYVDIYISQTFIPRIYKLDWKRKRGELLYKGEEPMDCIDGLTTIGSYLFYTHLEGFGAFNMNTFRNPGTPVRENEWHKVFATVPGMVNTAFIPALKSGFGVSVTLSELWLLYPGTVNSDYADIADGRKSVYASAYQCRLQSGIDKFKKIVKDRNMNSIVIDMKDDYGLLRYDTKDPLVKEKGKVSAYAIPDLDHFIEEFKKDNIYLVARIVTFKDRSLAKYDGGKYAVWDKKYRQPWCGIRYFEDVLDENGNPTGEEKAVYYDENWVDPYSEEVWEYNVAVAKELIERGFDEVQFDYIRFPTDGKNLYNASYRWQDEGMDKESALISFLSYARENIDAPIGIDIYGANGWYRSGTRTGQDAEMLAEYVDVIGPMFYPSHFENSFLNYAPVKDRTYRIYYYGSFRNTILCRNRAIVRPWVQSFYLNVPYDKQYYDQPGAYYIKKQFFGVRDSIDRGYMCWNNSGKYDVTPADVGDDEPFPGTAPEASDEYRKPAIGTAKKPLSVPDKTDVSVLDSILYQNYDENRVFTPFLQVLP